tara:strand:- start:344 stop:1282 length:939 start_codon:yes stop_codon:yes gene_type:complete
LKLIKSQPSRNHNLYNIKYFVDPETDKILDIKKDKKKITDLMIRNVKQNRYINPKNIIPPRQCSSNCWFNVFFMMHFVSDLGRKFTRPMRLAMINKSYNINVKKANKRQLNSAMFMLNLAIEATLSGSSTAKQMNTNQIISTIYDSFQFKSSGIVKAGQFGNSFEYFSTLVKVLYPHDENPLYIVEHYIEFDKLSTRGRLPHMCIIQISDDDSRHTNKQMNIQITSTSDDTKGTYLLDSICIRDIEEQHVGCLVTLRNRGYFFDGDSSKRLRPLDWTNNTYINKPSVFRMSNGDACFNLKKGYQILYYYRIK